MGCINKTSYSYNNLEVILKVGVPKLLQFNPKTKHRCSDNAPPIKIMIVICW